MLRIAAASSLLVLLVTAPAQAQSIGSDAKAEDLIRQANVLRQKGQDVAALPLMREAYDLARNPRTAAQLGLVELALGYWVDSDAHLSEALSPSRHPWVDRNRKILEDSRVQARAHIANLQLSGTSGADVRVNGALVGTFPLSSAIRVGEGHVTIEVNQTGYLGQSRSFEIAGGATQRFSFDLAPTRRPEPSAPAVPPPPADIPAVVTTKPPASSTSGELPTWRRALPWGLGAGAVAAAGFAVWQHVEWRHSNSQFEAIHGCAAGEPGHGSDDRCNGLFNDLTSHRNQAYVGYGIAGALGIGSAVLFVLNASSSDETKVAIAPGPTPFGLTLRGRF